MRLKYSLFCQQFVDSGLIEPYDDLVTYHYYRNAHLP